MVGVVPVQVLVPMRPQLWSFEVEGLRALVGRIGAVEGVQPSSSYSIYYIDDEGGSKCSIHNDQQLLRYCREKQTPLVVEVGDGQGGGREAMGREVRRIEEELKGEIDRFKDRLMNEVKEQQQLRLKQFIDSLQMNKQQQAPPQQQKVIETVGDLGQRQKIEYLSTATGQPYQKVIALVQLHPTTDINQLAQLLLQSPQ